MEKIGEDGLDLAVVASVQPIAVRDPQFVELRKYWSEEQIIEIVGVVAMAGFLARWNADKTDKPADDEPQGMSGHRGTGVCRSVSIEAELCRPRRIRY